MRSAILENLLKISWFVSLPENLEKEFRDSQRHSFVAFFRTALLFGMVAYGFMIIWDFIMASHIFVDILAPRATMLVLFALVYASTFYKKFYLFGQYVGIAFIIMLMLNVMWVQALIEQGLEEGYGMLITPGSTTSVIVFSGAEMGYGALLTPLLMLPIGFTALQAFITSSLVIAVVNVGMYHTELPEAFVQTANSVFISIGIFTTILAYLVNQHRRKAFKLEYDLRIARDEALEANMAKSNFLATMSHEVRTPLNGILGMTSLLLQTSLTVKQKDYLQTVKYSGEALLTMLNDILDFSKMEAGKFEIETIDLDLYKLVRSVADLMRSRAEEQSIVIQVEIDDDVPPFIHSDPTRLRQVLLNLISNGIKFTEQGYVKIAVHKGASENKGMTLRFDVIDTGIGMPKEALGKLFQEFTQADSSTSRKYGGTGLGLSICKRIIDLLEGQIQVESEPGKGSVFWFEIPVQSADGTNLEEMEELEVIPDIAPLHILLAEDNKINAQVATDFLRSQNHTVHLATDGQEALNALQDNDFDLVLMDMQMPNMDGLEATRIIKSWGNQKSEIPVIALTANDFLQDVARCLEAGMIDHITKPFSKATLFSTIAEHVGETRISSTQVHEKEEDFGEKTIDFEILQDLEETFNRDYVLRFLEKNLPTIHEYILEIQRSGRNKDTKALLDIVHQLKGVGALCGLTQLYAVADNIEKSCHDQNHEEAYALSESIFEIYEENLKKLNQHYPVKFSI